MTPLEANSEATRARRHKCNLNRSVRLDAEREYCRPIVSNIAR